FDCRRFAWIARSIKEWGKPVFKIGTFWSRKDLGLSTGMNGLSFRLVRRCGTEELKERLQMSKFLICQISKTVSNRETLSKVVGETFCSGFLKKEAMELTCDCNRVFSDSERDFCCEAAKAQSA
ncbi:unnamed protein product, partial [Enterobius vermicularis]|uniref:MATH domain-containing protein n=1 Tax=Enterobius vermicularis TaxID=51028 RepID=A0A0N4V0H5_ENTVE